jgi:TolB protein
VFEKSPTGDDPYSTEIYVMNADDGSGGQTRLTRITDSGASASSPSWSPDGKKIAFVSDRALQDPEGLNRNYEIYVINADNGSEQTRLTNNNASDGSPSWSPYGEKIAFRSNRDACGESDDNAIYIMNIPDGSNVIRLTEPDSYFRP